ncbi:MAG: DUF1990 domain-containing protein [Planctomycetia bacterium]|nr:DUF1990 domain-containing protein [Planctomycetia bacterium]
MHYRKPSSGTIQEVLNSQRSLGLTYADVGATAGAPPAGFNVDRTRIKLGQGEPAFAAAKRALRQWKHFQLGWLEACPTDTPIQKHEVIAVVACFFGWWVNCCRIVYVIDESRRFGFAYGTLPDHAESGEERFLIEIDPQGNVWYDILAFSRPRHLLVRLGTPYARRMQKRFGHESAAAMQRAVQELLSAGD